MRIVVAGLLLVLLVSCGEGEGESGGDSDCGLAIRSEGTVYSEAGFVKGPAKSVGQADFASCDDVGEDARGAYFPDDPRQVEVWSFEGQDTGRVLGTLESNGRYRVFVAEGQDADEVLRALRQSQKNGQ